MKNHPLKLNATQQLKKTQNETTNHHPKSNTATGVSGLLIHSPVPV